MSGRLPEPLKPAAFYLIGKQTLVTDINEVQGLHLDLGFNLFITAHVVEHQNVGISG